MKIIPAFVWFIFIMIVLINVSRSFPVFDLIPTRQAQKRTDMIFKGTKVKESVCEGLLYNEIKKSLKAKGGKSGHKIRKRRIKNCYQRIKEQSLGIDIINICLNLTIVKLNVVNFCKFSRKTIKLHNRMLK